MEYFKHSKGQRPNGPKPQPKLQEKGQRQRTGGPEDYGTFYWCVKTELSEDGEIYLFADEVRFTPTGGVLFLGTQERNNLALGPGQWSAVYAASCLDGHAIAVERWEGEIVR